jgi:sulfur relay (sulfurtransferase) complex TusBCD TusD component (DsrE family)
VWVLAPEHLDPPAEERVVVSRQQPLYTGEASVPVVVCLVCAREHGEHSGKAANREDVRHDYVLGTALNQYLRE